MEGRVLARVGRVARDRILRPVCPAGSRVRTRSVRVSPGAARVSRPIQSIARDPPVLRRIRPAVRQHGGNRDGDRVCRSGPRVSHVGCRRRFEFRTVRRGQRDVGRGAAKAGARVRTFRFAAGFTPSPAASRRRRGRRRRCQAIGDGHVARDATRERRRGQLGALFRRPPLAG